jgi:hypothetical protein
MCFDTLDSTITKESFFFALDGFELVFVSCAIGLADGVAGLAC